MFYVDVGVAGVNGEVASGLCGMTMHCLSWVARVNGGVASGLGGALVLSGGCGSNIVPCMAHFAQRAEVVWGMRRFELQCG